MKYILFALLGITAVLTAPMAAAGPEDDRAALVDYFKKRFPDIKFEDYVYGSLALDPDSKAQYDSIMDFPPFASQLDAGKKMWGTPLKSGKKYEECLPDGGKMIAGNYPRFDEKKGKVVTLEDLINDCRVANGEEPYKYGDAKTMGILTAYMRTLSDGMPMNIKVEGPRALAAFEDGKKTFYARHGQLNFSCATCHVDNAGNRLRSELLHPVIGAATHWPVFRGGDTLVTLQTRYEGCYKSIRAVGPAPGTAVLNNLEYFHSYLSNGLPLRASVFRK